MTESAEKEPTMEEILSSIRRIISEEDEDAAQQQAEPSAAAPVEAEAEEEDGDAEILELTQPLEEPEDPAPAAADVVGDDLLVLDADEPAVQAAPLGEAAAPDAVMAGIGEAAPEPDMTAAGIGDRAHQDGAPGAGAMEWGHEEGAMSDRLIGDQAASAAAGAFARLARSTRVPESADDKTLEAIVRELLRPMLKDWLEANLPAIVEKKVREEVERIARQS